MSALEVLEDRIVELENKIYGSTKRPFIDDPVSENTVIDNLMTVNTRISSALSGREKTSGLVKRMQELNEMLDPSYDAIDLHTQAKLELILAMESEIKEHLKNLQQINELNPCLQLDKIKDVPDLTPKLSRLTLSYLKTHEESEELTRNISSAASEYNNIITNIARTLIGLDAAVKAAEDAATPKKQVD